MSFVIALLKVHIEVDIFTFSQFLVVKEDTIAPLIAQEAFRLIHLMPAVAIDDLLVAQKALKDESVHELDPEGILLRFLLELLFVWVRVELPRVMLAESLFELKLQLIFHIIVGIHPEVVNRGRLLLALWIRYSFCTIVCSSVILLQRWAHGHWCHERTFSATLLLVIVLEVFKFNTVVHGIGLDAYWLSPFVIWLLDCI